ncbi:hypothetical protein WME76_12625 [Sorangium sp. So ce119]|uniref:hypothetical protein n=1 Tax=Sorangium sp. So ce119 TaxID=3133279 RepID=UPI003F627890
MHEPDKIKRRAQDNYERFYNEIEIVEELRDRGGILAKILRAADSLQDAACLTTVAGLIVLDRQGGSGNPVWWLCGIVALVTLSGLVVIALNRGRNAETGKYRSQGPAQPGTARASPRKARASSGDERGG